MSEIHIHIDLGWNANQTDKKQKKWKKKVFFIYKQPIHNYNTIRAVGWLTIKFQTFSFFFSTLLSHRWQIEGEHKNGTSASVDALLSSHGDDGLRESSNIKRTQYRIWHKVKQAMGGYCFWFKTEKKRRNLWFRGLQRILMPRMCRQGRKFLVYLFRLYSLLCCGLYQRGPSLLS